MGRLQAHAHRSGAETERTSLVPRVAAVPWMEILVLALGVALIVTLICTGQRP